MNISGISSYSYFTALSVKNANGQKTPVANDPISGLIDPTGGAASSSPTAAVSVAATKKPTAADDFLSYMHMSTGEKMMYGWLAQHGISKEKFDAMSPEDKQKLLAQMKQDIEREAKQKAETVGSRANILA